MRDARDAEDKRLLDEGEIELLLAAYVDTIFGRCVARMRGVVGEDVAQAVCERLWKELKAGRHRDSDVPFRVIIGNVIKWTCDGWYERGWGEWELVEGDGATGADPTGESDLRLDLEAFVAGLPAGDGEVARLTWLEGLAPAEAAARLRKEPNAVYQAVHRNKAKLKTWLAE